METPPLSALAPTRKRHRNQPSPANTLWTSDQDRQLVTLLGSSPVPPDWATISQFFPTKSEKQISDRWTKVLDPSLLKGSWTREEDAAIIDFVRCNGTKSWMKLSERLPGRLGKQCRERWFNALDPAICRDPWTPEEDDRLIELHEHHGNRWTIISGLMQTRSANAIKNRWYSTLAKRPERGTPAPTPVASPSKMVLPSIALFAGRAAPIAQPESVTIGGPGDAERTAGDDGVALENSH
jgi:hypothetical protein